MTQRRRALLIATDTYTDPAFARLTAPANDVARLAEVLGDPEIGAFTVTSLVNEPSHVVRNGIDELCSTAERGDLILLYVSGHGIKDEAKGHLHFATADTRRALLTTTSVEASLVRRLIDASPARQAIVWLDCCFSGAFPAGETPKSAPDADVLAQLRFAGARGCCVMTASTHIQFAYEPNQDPKALGTPQISRFTNAIVEGLATGKADLDNDGEIGTTELYDYVYTHIRALTPSQTPTRNDLAHGDFLVAWNKFGLRLPPGLSPAIRGLLKSPDPDDRQLALTHLRSKAEAGDTTALEALAVLRAQRDLTENAASERPVPTPSANSVKTALPATGTTPNAEPKSSLHQVDSPVPTTSQPVEPKPAPDLTETPPSSPIEAPAPTTKQPAEPQPGPAASTSKPAEPGPAATLPPPLPAVARDPSLPTTARRKRNAPIIVPSTSLPRLSTGGKVGMWVAGWLVVLPPAYMVWLHEGNVFWTVVLWIAAGIAAIAAAANLGATLLRVGKDTSRVLHYRPSRDKSRLRFSPDGTMLIAGRSCWDTTLWGWGSRSDDWVISPDNTMLVSRVKGELTLSGQPGGTRELPGVRSALFSPDSTLLVLVGDKFIRVVRASGEEVTTLPDVPLDGVVATFDPSGRLFAMATAREHAPVIYDTATWRQLVLPDSLNFVRLFAFNHDGTRVAAVHGHRIDIVRTDDWHIVRSISGDSRVLALDFSPDGRLLATGDWDRKVTLYSTRTWVQAKSLTGHHGMVTDVRFSPDSAILVSAGDDRSIRLWQVR